MAQELGEEEVARLLQETLDEEGVADRNLSLVAQEEVLPDALGEEDDGEAEDAASQLR